MARVKQVKRQLSGDPEVLKDMFDEMMGVKDADASIVVPKIVKSLNTIKNIVKVLTQIATFAPLHQNFPEIKDSLDEIVVFTEKINKTLDLKPGEEKEDKYITMEKKEINKFYKQLKESDGVKLLIIMCSKLKSYGRYIENNSNLKDNFIGQEPGLSLRIFAFSSLDLKLLWASKHMTPSVKKYILTILHVLYKRSYELYQTTTSPDVDVERFSSVLIQALSTLKKHPELSRCTRAFARIEKSVDLLKNKFDGYYRESVACSNSNMILESFIVDVANQGAADPKLTREFRQIIQYMHKVGAQTGKTKDPNVQKMLKALNANISIMEKSTGAKTFDVSTKGKKSDKDASKNTAKNIVKAEEMPEDDEDDVDEEVKVEVKSEEKIMQERLMLRKMLASIDERKEAAEETVDEETTEETVEETVEETIDETATEETTAEETETTAEEAVKAAAKEAVKPAEETVKPDDQVQI